MKFSVPLHVSLLFAAPAFAQADQAAPPVEDKSQASQAAENFSLDLPAGETAPAAEAAPSTPAPEPAAAPETSTSETTAPETPAAVSRFTVDTPIEMLLANVRAKAVLDRNLPGLSTDKNLDKIRNLSLRALQSHSGGKLTDALLDKTGKELAEIPPETRLPPGR